MNEVVQNTHWAAALAGDEFDLTELAAALNEAGVSVEKTERDGWLLTASEFEGLENAAEVRRTANEILDVVNGAGVLIDRGYRPVNAGHVYRIHTDGRKDAFVMLESAIEVRARVHAARVSVTSDGPPPPPPTSRIDKAVAASAIDPNVARALHIYGQRPRSFVSLYKVFELSQQHPQHDTWSSKSQRERFTHSANSPDVHGDDARHAVQRTEPPAQPMTLNEAETLIGAIVTSWVDSVWDSIADQ